MNTAGKKKSIHIIPLVEDTAWVIHSLENDKAYV